MGNIEGSLEGKISFMKEATTLTDISNFKVFAETTGEYLNGVSENYIYDYNQSMYIYPEIQNGKLVGFVTKQEEYAGEWIYVTYDNTYNAETGTLVVAGELINDLAARYHTPILPVDSEHSAIFQCLEVNNPLEKVILTASGGPFRSFSMEQLKTVTKAQALKHPNWDMGAKITIDSATMMNKGFEVIEAKWLFGVRPDQIEVVVHPQSIIHSMVQYEDGAVKAQLGMPDMRLPIQYAFSYPQRVKSSFDRLDFATMKELTFEQPDTKRFRCLALAYEALNRGGNMACIVNAANEVVVSAFLQERIPFLRMSEIIEQSMEKVSFIAAPTYEDYVATDAEARRIAESLL